MKSQLPSDSRFQCPACGAPVSTVELPYRRFGEAWALGLDCGHSISLEMVRDSWGVDVPEPQGHIPKRP